MGKVGENIKNSRNSLELTELKELMCFQQFLQVPRVPFSSLLPTPLYAQIPGNYQLSAAR